MDVSPPLPLGEGLGEGDKKLMYLLANPLPNPPPKGEGKDTNLIYGKRPKSLNKQTDFVNQPVKFLRCRQAKGN